jgi:hypothetical protein
MAFYVYYGQETWVELFDPTNTWQEDVEAEGPRGRLSHGHPRQLSLTFSFGDRSYPFAYVSVPEHQNVAWTWHKSEGSLVFCGINPAQSARLLVMAIAAMSDRYQALCTLVA